MIFFQLGIFRYFLIDLSVRNISHFISTCHTWNSLCLILELNFPNRASGTFASVLSVSVCSVAPDWITVSVFVSSDHYSDYGYERRTNGKCTPAFWFHPSSMSRSCTTGMTFLNSTGYARNESRPESAHAFSKVTGRHWIKWTVHLSWIAQGTLISFSGTTRTGWGKCGLNDQTSAFENNLEPSSINHWYWRDLL